jgi:hypothetical protein
MNTITLGGGHVSINILNRTNFGNSQCICNITLATGMIRILGAILFTNLLEHLNG